MGLHFVSHFVRPRIFDSVLFTELRLWQILYTGSPTQEVIDGGVLTKWTVDIGNSTFKMFSLAKQELQKAASIAL